MIESRAFKKMFRALESKDLGLVQSLVVQGTVNPNALMSGKGVSLLHLIIGHQSESFAFAVTKMFLTCGGDPNIQSIDGVTPVHVAATWGRNKILHLLLINGGDPWLQDEEKKNAFNYAFEEKKWSTIEMLYHFQQMHSAATWKKDTDTGGKYDLSLERIFLRKGNEKFAFVPIEKFTKSMTTQTQCDVHSRLSSSPVQDKIKYFEPQENSNEPLLNGNKKEQESSKGWIKDFYQSSCEVVVHRSNEVSETKRQSPKTFISSIHIDTSPPKLDFPQGNFQKTKSSLDVRSQLFVELEEAVRRRSKSKTFHETHDRLLDNSVLEDSILVKGDSGERSSFDGKEVAHLYGVNLEDNKMLKNMSDFATKVMKEIESTEENSASHGTIDLCASSPELSNAYASCEEESRSVRPSLAPDDSHLYFTPYNSNLSNDLVLKSKDDNSNESFVSVAEEYKRSDIEEGVVLIEKKFLLTPTVSLGLRQSEECIQGDDKSESSSVPGSTSYNSDLLRSELTGLGYNPGPVTKTTKKLYLKKLRSLKKKTREDLKEATNYISAFPSHLESTMTDVQVFEEIPSRGVLEEEMCSSFENWKEKKWREGASKTSFNYLLLDPRISSNLPKRAFKMAPIETWRSFLSAIFYVGKGKRTRPYAHLHQATAFWEKRTSWCPDKKVKRIVDIWREGWGVVCLHVFQNTIPVEAFTREAAMIDALGLSNLNNARAGKYYGVVSTWPDRDKVDLGIYLLHKAMSIFLSEGERQIKPFDID